MAHVLEYLPKVENWKNWKNEKRLPYQGVVKHGRCRSVFAATADHYWRDGT